MEPIILTVTTTADQNDGNQADGLSLREAILTANANPTQEYIINLPSLNEGVTIYDLNLKNTLDAPLVDVTSIDLDTLIEQRLTTGDLDVRGNLTIIGEDPDNIIIDADNLKTNFEARLASLPIAPLEGGEEDPIPGLESELISVTIDGIPISESPIPIGRTAEFSTAQYTISDRVFDVEAGATFNLNNVTVENGLLVTTKEVILDLVDQDPENGRTGEIYTRTYSIVIGFDEEGNPIEAEVIEQYRLKDVITPLDIEAGGQIATGNVDTTPEGAGIQVDANATVTLDNVIVQNNSTETIAGGIYNEGDLVVNRSVIQENNSAEGTGIHNANNARIYNSLVANNFAGINALRTESGVERFVFPIGAGIFNQSTGILTVANSTIYGNEGGVDLGGGILTEGQANIINSTIIENIGQGGAGIWANTQGANVLLHNSIVAQNKKPNFDYYGTFLGLTYNVPDVEGFIDLDSSYNYLGYANGVLVDGVRGNIARTNISNTTQPIDIGLGDLQDNGGATPTVSISSNSPFIDQGTNTIDQQLLSEISRYFPTSNLINGEATDQRITQTIDENGIITRTGFERIANGTVDIGAFEFNAQEIQVVIEPSNPDDPDDPDDPNPEVPNNPDNPNQNVDRDNHPLENDSGSGTDNDNSDNGGNGTDTGDNTDSGNGENGNVDNSEDGMDIPDAPDQPDDNSEVDPLALLDMPLFRWQNNDRLGTYLFANEGESEQIAADETLNFTNEGFAFRVGSNDADDLTAFYRFHNDAVPGTYLYVNEFERLEILSNPNYDNFDEEGLAFYAYEGSADVAEDVYRLQNKDQQGTYLFVNETEKNQILANPNYNYQLEGVAFEASFSL